MRNTVIKLLILLLILVFSLSACAELEKLINPSEDPTVEDNNDPSDDVGDPSDDTNPPSDDKNENPGDTKECQHVWVNPTCTSDGYCSLCSEKGDEATGHSYNSTVTEPTCTSGGYTTHVCSSCADSYVSSQVPPNGHSYSSKLTSPTCTEGGYTTYTCSDCNDTYTDNATSATGHSYTNGVCGVCGANDPGYTPPGVGSFNYSDVPEFSGENYVVINNNTPYFTKDEITDVAFESYGELDALGRCTVAFASLGKELLPTGSRPSISYNPTGWVQNTYPSSLVPQSQIYNRSHLIAWSLAGEGNNKNNLITGTPYFNQIGMQIFENQVLDYIKETGNHVMYRVTPIFLDNDLVARGVLIEAWSVEDNGDGICFNVFLYNVQPGITIDYATGENWKTETDDPGNTPTLSATLVTDISQISAGAKIIIVASGKNYALGAQSKNNRSGAEISIDGNTAYFSDDVQIITIGAGISSGSYSLGVDGGYLYAASSSNNYLRTESTLTANSSWTIQISSKGIATIKSTGSYTRNWLRYNPQNYLFAAYASGQSDICIYIIND